MQPRIRPFPVVLLGFCSLLAAGEAPADEPYAAVQANVTVTSVRLTDNGDDDGFADPNETVNVYVTLKNGSGTDRHGIVVRMGSTDPSVGCIPSPIAWFGSLLDGEAREGPTPLVFRVADVVRLDPFQDLPVSLDFAVSGDDFDTTGRGPTWRPRTNPQTVTLETDLNASGGFLPTSYSEGFESGGFGSFTTQSLDAGRESLAASDGYRCQYNDPDFANSNSYGNTHCYLGGSTPGNNAYDWHVHGTSAPDGGRAYLGNNSLHWGMHPGAASADTARLRQLDAIRTLNPVNLGWNGLASELSFKHQVAFAYGDDGMFVDRGIVQVQLANSAGQPIGPWRKISPYQNLYDSPADHRYRNCMFDPIDDGSTEDDYFDPADPARRLGPSSTCLPEFAFTRQGAIFYASVFNENDVGYAEGPGLQGDRGPGTWVETKFRLDRWRGHRLRLRFLVSSIEIATLSNWQQAMNWNPFDEDDGWYIDDVRVSNTLTSAATVLVDTADRSGLPACGPVCTSVTASLVVTPEPASCGEVFTLDASGSTADQCPGGALQFRFWWIWSESPPGGILEGLNASLLQDWNESAVISHAAQTIGAHPYRVDVRCSTLPACGASTTAVGTVDSSSCPLIDRSPSTIRFDSESVFSWATGTGYVIGVRGNLGALRASGGNFAGTTESGFGTPLSYFDTGFQPVPAPGEGKYYLVRGARIQPPNRCTLYSWSTGSPAEVPGVGGTRDQQLGLDPGGCP